MRRAVFLMLVFGSAVGALPGHHAGAAAGLEPNGNPLWGVPLSRLSATRERPIFSGSRRPPPPVVVAAAPVVAPLPPAAPPLPERPALVLIGTIVGGALQVGLFHDEATAKTLRLAVGESHQGWLLRAIGAADARFENADRAATLMLRPALQLAMKGDPAGDAGWPVPAVHRRRR